MPFTGPPSRLRYIWRAPHPRCKRKVTSMLQIFNASTCGNNCAWWLLRIAAERAKAGEGDVTVNLRHLMHFGRGRFSIRVLNSDTVVHNMVEMVSEA